MNDYQRIYHGYAIAAFVKFLQEKYTYPDHGDSDIAMSEALKSLAIKYKELVDANGMEQFGGMAPSGLWSDYFSSSILKLLRELPPNNVQDLSREVDRLRREEAEIEARALGGQIVYREATSSDTTSASTEVKGAYTIHALENGLISALNLNGDGPVTISVVVQKKGNPNPIEPNQNGWA